MIASNKFFATTALGYVLVYISSHLQWPQATFSCWSLTQVDCPSVLPDAAIRTANPPPTTPLKPLRRQRKSVAKSSIDSTYKASYTLAKTATIVEKDADYSK